MKKILISFLLLACSATSSFAVTSVDKSASVLGTTPETGWSVFGDKTTAAATTAKIGRLSSGVGLAFFTSTASYALITQHKSGVRKYGSASDSTLINWSVALKDTVIAIPSAASVTAISGAGWTGM